MSRRSAVLAHGLRPRANTADRGPVTEPIRNYLINNIIEAKCLVFSFLTRELTFSKKPNNVITNVGNKNNNSYKYTMDIILFHSWIPKELLYTQKEIH